MGIQKAKYLQTSLFQQTRESIGRVKMVNNRDMKRSFTEKEGVWKRLKVKAMKRLWKWPLIQRDKNFRQTRFTISNKMTALHSPIPSTALSQNNSR